MTVNAVIVGPFFNAGEHVSPWLAALQCQTYSDLRIVAVDDGSTDGTAQALKSAAASSRVPTDVILSDRNAGPAAARNRGIARALDLGADLVLLLDGDCRVDNDWAQRHVDAHRSNPGAHIVGGTIQGAAQSYIGRADGYASWFTSVPGSSSGPVRRWHLPTTNMSIKREVFERVGLFDESLVTGEDVVFCHHARAARFTLWFQGDIVCRHLDRDVCGDARRHHYRWGLHSYFIASERGCGYYQFLRKVPLKWVSAMMVPAIAFLTTGLCIARYLPRDAAVLFYLPGIFYLKCWNAVGIHRGRWDCSLCRRSAADEPA
jgi:GT2 family glycosyltransferase